MKKQLVRNIRIARVVWYKETLIDYKEHFWTFMGAFTGIAAIGFFNHQYFGPYDTVFLIGSFGASAVLIYGIINSPLAQPRNLIGGHLTSAFIGVTIHLLIPDQVWLACALAASLSIVFMQITKTLHPPGGATALIANIGSEKVTDLGYWYMLSPVLSGVLILLLVALIFNNITQNRRYPNNKNWHRFWKRNYLK